jgi:translation initiation factor 2 alpha subunit (eIF-2alpha)
MQQIKIEEGDIVLCTVERTEGTAVFVKIEDNGEGSIVLSEIAPGRIRNLREYVVPNKKIVCKVLEIRNNHIELSLRRVTAKERKEIMEAYQKEKRTEGLFKTLLKDRAEAIISQIKKTEKLSSFIERAKDNPKELEKIFGKEGAGKIIEIFAKQKEKKTIVKKDIEIKTEAADGIQVIKNVLSVPEVKVTYYAAGRYNISAESINIKEASRKLNKALETIHERAKKSNLTCIIKEK